MSVGADLPADTCDRIELKGLRAVGTHGVLAEEKVRAQPFEADLVIEMDLRRAGSSDALGDTADYGAVAEAVVAVMEGPHVELLERLAEEMAAAAAQAAPEAVAISVTVRKMRPPVPVQLESAGVVIRRRRDELIR